MKIQAWPLKRNPGLRGRIACLTRRVRHRKNIGNEREQERSFSQAAHLAKIVSPLNRGEKNGKKENVVEEKYAVENEMEKWSGNIMAPGVQYYFG